MNCVSTCPSQPRLYGYDGNKTCLNPCISSTFSHGDNCYTAANCPSNTYADSTTYSCVLQCPGDTFADTNDKICKNQCPIG